MLRSPYVKSFIQQALVIAVFSFVPPALQCQTPTNSTPTFSTERVQRANQELEKVKKLVEIGAEARVRIDQAERELADAQDEALLSQTRYRSADLTDQL